MTTRKTDSRERTEQTVHTSRRSERNNNRDGIYLTGTGIAFGNSNDITDSGNGLSVFSVGDIIEVEGTASNNGRFTLTAVAAGTISCAETIVTESAGNSVTIKRVG